MIKHDPDQHWVMRLLRGLHDVNGAQSFEACILRAVLGSQRRGLPRYGSRAVIDENGRIIANFQARDGTLHKAVWVRDEMGVGQTAATIGAKFRRVADTFKLDDDERTELFAKLSYWIAADLRARRDIRLS